MRKSSDEFADQAADAAKRNVPMLPPTRNMITQRARSMLLEDLEIESAHIYSRVARFIYGFGDKQIQEATELIIGVREKLDEAYFERFGERLIGAERKSEQLGSLKITTPD